MASPGLSPISEKKRRRILFLKTDLPAIFAFILFIGLIFFYLIPGFQNAMMERKRVLIKEITSSSYSVILYFHSLETSGAIGREEAMSRAKDAIASIRYGDRNKDYFWITDRVPVMVIHPYRPDLNGKDLSDFRDSKGKLIFVEFARAVEPTGESYVEYMWQWNDDSTKIVPKLSYVRLFEPWNWIIGTGIYIDDVKTEIRKVELTALIISGIIATVIMILLSVVTRHSHRIEQKRKKTEEDLIKSRELYRTLAEAATEGVLIWTNNEIQANKPLLSILGYTEDSFRLLNIENIISSEDINISSGADKAYDELGLRQFGECSLVSSDGSIIKAHSGYSRIMLGDNKAVVIVVHPVKQQPSAQFFTLPSRIVQSVGTGIFRISIGKKSRFIHATSPALRILGFSTFDELQKVPFENFFTESLQLRQLKKNLASKVAVTDYVMTMTDRQGNMFKALINLAVVDHNYPEIWCEGTIEYIIPTSGYSENVLPIPGFYYQSLLRTAPAGRFAQKPVLCGSDTPAVMTLELLSKTEARFAVVTDENGLPSGITDSAEIIMRLARGEEGNTDTASFITHPPEYIDRNTTLGTVAEYLLKNPSRALLIKDESGIITGLLSAEIILRLPSASDNLVSDLVSGPSDAGELQNIVLKIRDLAIAMILGKTDPLTITSFISSGADLICNKIISMALDMSGPPPCRFSFIQTGSAGRMEQTLLTDQDNGIIFEDVPPDRLNDTKEYFGRLGRRINEMLQKSGYNYCKGNNMAGNPKWCQPLSVWKEYFASWIRIPEPGSILDISIFFDFRHLGGDGALADELRDFVKNNLKINDIYFHHMTEAWTNFRPALLRENSGMADLKKIAMPLTGLVRLYSLKYGIKSFSTTSRLLALYNEGLFNAAMLKDLLGSVRLLSSVRLWHQADCINRGLIPDNMIDTSMISGDTMYHLNRSVENINTLIMKAGNDFYVTGI